jgi:hypothetical protein
MELTVGKLKKIIRDLDDDMVVSVVNPVGDVTELDSDRITIGGYPPRENIDDKHFLLQACRDMLANGIIIARDIATWRYGEDYLCFNKKKR